MIENLAANLSIRSNLETSAETLSYDTHTKIKPMSEKF